MRHFTEDDVRKLLSMKDAIARVRQAFADYAEGRAKNQPRRRLTLESGATLHQLAGAWGNYFGAKIYSTHPRYGAHFTALLYGTETGEPLAQFEANWLGQIRTGAVSGLVADLLAPARELRVGCIGSGFQARSQLEAVCAVRSVASVGVWSRDASKREKFAKEMRTLLRVSVEPVRSAAETASGAHILITATWAKDPVIEASAVAPGTLVLAMGSNQPARRELPPELVLGSLVVVDDKEACRIEAGDLLLAFEDADWNRVLELKQLVHDPSLAASAHGKTTVFKSVGLGLEDVAVGGWVLEQASGKNQ